MREIDSGILFNTPSKDKWERLGTKRRAGILVPLFSVYSKKSLGIGDLDDLKFVIDLCRNAGFSILQLLPMNEVGTTFCPYDALSSFALEPAYISLDSIISHKKGRMKSRISGLKKRFGLGKNHLDYRIKDEKILLLRQIYEESPSRGSKEFKRFVENNSYWVHDFALYKVLKSYHAGLPWYEWEDRYKDRDTKAIDGFKKEREEDIAFEMWLQWLAYNQFKAAKDYAESKSIKICGDLPILISRDSSDVWTHPDFFKLEFAAGAPPDMYCAKGQRWGMPTYNWDEIGKDNYTYIKEKLRHAEEYYDMLRVDHVVGLFRIWSIPHDEPFENEGLNGFFDPRDEKEWKGHGKNILSMMCENTKMLLIAEDLGIIPRVCQDTIKELGIPGNDVQRWTKDWKVKHDFLGPQDYRFLSVAMLSTHDTTNWADWWETEAGTVDEPLFIRKCHDRGIDYASVKGNLFDSVLSRRGRLRWLSNVASKSILIDILGKKEEEVLDFIEMYENTYQEKDKLWKCLKMQGPMREGSDSKIVKAALSVTLNARSVFCIELLTDYLIFGGIVKGEFHRYRINRPGTVSKENWSLITPIPLEGLLGHKVWDDIRVMVKASGRM